MHATVDPSGLAPASPELDFASESAPESPGATVDPSGPPSASPGDAPWEPPPQPSRRKSCPKAADPHVMRDTDATVTCSFRNCEPKSRGDAIVAKGAWRPLLRPSRHAIRGKMSLGSTETQLYRATEGGRARLRSFSGTRERREGDSWRPLNERRALQRASMPEAFLRSLHVSGCRSFMR